MKPAFANTERSLIELADRAMSRGEIAKAASLLERAAQRGDDASTLLRLATVRRALGDLAGAMAAAGAAVKLAPRNFLMALLLGSLRETTGAVHGAVRAYRAALPHAPPDLSLQPAMARQVKHARRWVAAEDGWRERLLAWDYVDHPKLRGAERRRMRGFRADILENLAAGVISQPMFNIPGLNGPNYFPPAAFANAHEVAARTNAIRAEFLSVVEKRGEMAARMRGLHGAERDPAAAGHWSMIPLIRNGRPIKEFAELCPVTMSAAALLPQPDIGMISPSLYFSVLEPGSRIPPHTGITNARVIGHWPLIVPHRCGFRVGGEERSWKVGEPLVFDDMITHEAWNESDQIRVVLIADLWRPELSAAELSVVTELMSLELLDA